MVKGGVVALLPGALPEPRPVKFLITSGSVGEEDSDMKGYEEALQSRLNQPFQRRQYHSESEDETEERVKKLKSDILDTLKLLGDYDEDEWSQSSRRHSRAGSRAGQGVNKPVLSTVHENAASNEELPTLTELYEMKQSVLSEDELRLATDYFSNRWKLKDEMSEVALKGMLLVLEHCLGSELQHSESFQHFVKSLGFHTVFFWKKAVPIIYNSDLQYGTNYREALLFSLTLYDVNEGHNRLRELFAAVPGLRDSLLGKHAKRFEEQFHHLLQRRSSFCTSQANSCQASDADPNDLANLNDFTDDLDDAASETSGTASSKRGSHGSYGRGSNGHIPPAPPPMLNRENSRGSGRDSVSNGVLESLAEEEEKDHSKSEPKPIVVDVDDVGIKLSERRKKLSVGTMSNDGILSSPGSCAGSQVEPPDTIVGGGLSSGQFQERVINVSNAPPVSLTKKELTGEWQIGQGSGGLVACCDPVMNKDTENIWLACFGPGANVVEKNDNSSSPLPSSTNSLGLPLIKKPDPYARIEVLHDPAKMEGDSSPSEVRNHMSLLGVLKNYNKDKYKLNPVQVPEEDYNVYYGGISNGLLWPALHNLPEYIVKEYETPSVLSEHWYAYVRVNYQFAINAVRNCRAQDFIWIHDYHLMLTGMIMQSLDSNVEVGFFLHIPFQPPEEFFTKYNQVAVAVLRGIIRFTKVGFQTHKDRKSFLDLVAIHLGGAKVQYDQTFDAYAVTHEGWTSNIGVFPVSIKNEEFISIAKSPEVIAEALEIRNKVKANCLPGGRIFFSVERFDYTKGIKEKLVAYRKYLETHPERHGMDVLLQVAVTNRRSVDSYRQYQDMVLGMAEKINEDFRCPEVPEWRPLIFKTEGLPRPTLVAHYLAMDVGIVTPKRDGMNLVAKEMLVCNPSASLLLSSGAGTEQQLSEAGFYEEDNPEQKCYHRVADVFNVEEYVQAFYDAAVEESAGVTEHGKKLNKFLMAHDIEKWSATFLDPSWTHDVIRTTKVHTLPEFYGLMMQTKNVRRQITERVLKGIPIKAHFGVSLSHAKDSLVNSCLTSPPGSTSIVLKAFDESDGKQTAKLDIFDEITELEKDLAFLEFVQSEEYDNVEQFLQTLEKFHPESPYAFQREIDEAITLISRGDHFQYFFTDRDGTLKSYSCSYASSIQPSYSGVIQATFAHRCTQYSAILTSAPLMNIGILDVQCMPDGYFCYGASGGREWYIDASKKFKDDSISESDLALVDMVDDKIRALLEKPWYHHFTWVGSGLQKHYGHITVARQDVYGSIDDEKSKAWLETVTEVVRHVDPEEKVFLISDTDLDIKIHLKAKMSGNIFHKGHGIRLFAQKMELDLAEGNILVCGDTNTDLKMLRECLKINPTNTYTVWVTTNEELRKSVEEICGEVGNKNFVFVSCPEVILGAMSQATIREVRLRPTASLAHDLD